MSLSLSKVFLLLLIAIFLTHLFDVNETARGYLRYLGNKVGLNIANTVTATPVCPVAYVCTPKQ